MADKERAKLVLQEIIRLYKTVPSKAHLFKTFYFAHLYYAQKEPDYLSDWPIVRMPRGPGIGNADELIDGLIEDDAIEVKRHPVGPYLPYQYCLKSQAIPAGISLEAIDAIKEAVEFTRDKSSAELTELTHEYSNSWREADNGDELNIYIDLIDEPEYQEQKAKMKGLADSLREVW